MIIVVIARYIKRLPTAKIIHFFDNYNSILNQRQENLYCRNGFIDMVQQKDGDNDLTIFFLMANSIIPNREAKFSPQQPK